MQKESRNPVEKAKNAAVEVLLHNSRGPCKGFFRTAGWGYPEPYTRDIMISALGILVSGNEQLIQALRMVLEERAETLHSSMDRFTIKGGRQHRHVHEGLVVRHKPYYAAWSYKIFSSERFDLLGNSLAILSGIASPSRTNELVTWIEAECKAFKENGELAFDLPPNFFPYIKPGDPEWRPRYEEYNRPGEYHNGGIWPFICGFYIAALIAAGRHRLAEKKLNMLTKLVRPACRNKVEYRFNEWLRAQDGTPQGQDCETWSAAMYLYAAHCVEQNKTPFFDEIRKS